LKDIKVYQVLLFTLSILILLSPLVYFMPEKGWDLAGLNLNFMTKEAFLHPKKQVKKDISSIVSSVDTTHLNQAIDLNSIKHTNGSTGTVGAPTSENIPGESSTEIQFNESGKLNLYRFFGKLDKLAANKHKLHLLHYGDSQIEGDRMTSYIRQRLQNQFGGNGPGLIPATNVYPTFSFKQTYSSNFLRYTCFGGEKLKSKKYGVMASASRFTPEFSDTIDVIDLPITEGWIEIEPSNSALSRSKTFNNVTLYYTQCVQECAIKVYQNNNLIHEDSLISDGKYHKLNLSFPSTPGKLKYVFNSRVSPTICGFSLEGDYGIQVDNVGMRGSSGTIFGHIDHTVLTKMYADLNAEFFILQFGGNSMPMFKDSTMVKNYANYFQSQIRTLKRLRPSASILVIGPSDMSLLNDGIFETYPFLPYCVEQMKKAAFSQGAAYWDLFSAMGGLNSMQSWVDKGLAGKDYIHFSNKGASIASQLFYDAFIAEYIKWKQGVQP
jgi:lysophospholipase L1-like esterase